MLLATLDSLACAAAAAQGKGLPMFCLLCGCCRPVFTWTAAGLGPSSDALTRRQGWTELPALPGPGCRSRSYAIAQGRSALPGSQAVALVPQHRGARPGCHPPKRSLQSRLAT